MKMRYLIFCLLLIIVLPLTSVKAASNFNTGDCIEDFGKITFISAGSDNDVGGKVFFSNKSKTGSWSTSTVTFDAKVQATTNHKIKSIGYSINSKDGFSCNGIITGSLVENNTGHVKIGVEINKGYVIDMAFWGYSVSRSGNGKTDTTKSNVVNVKREMTDAEKKELEDSGYEIGGGDKLTCTTIDDIIGEYWSWVMILSPVVTMLLITLDFLKVIVNGKAAEEMKKATDRTLKRVIALVLLLMLPVITSFIFGLFNIETCF